MKYIRKRLIIWRSLVQAQAGPHKSQAFVIFKCLTLLYRILFIWIWKPFADLIIKIGQVGKDRGLMVKTGKKVEWGINYSFVFPLLQALAFLQ